MSDAKSKLVRAWLLKADHDLVAARKLSDESDPFLDTAIYNCQIDLTQPFESRFAELFDRAVLLTPYVAAYRYPGDILEPTLALLRASCSSCFLFCRSPFTLRLLSSPFCKRFDNWQPNEMIPGPIYWS